MSAQEQERGSASELTQSLACPFCGMPSTLDDPDTIYPTGSGWREDDGIRYYVSYRDAPKEQWCWGVRCPTPAGGCGAEIIGDSRDEAIAKWNMRANAQGNWPQRAAQRSTK